MDLCLQHGCCSHLFLVILRRDVTSSTAAEPLSARSRLLSSLSSTCFVIAFLSPSFPSFPSRSPLSPPLVSTSPRANPFTPSTQPTTTTLSTSPAKNAQSDQRSRHASPRRGDEHARREYMPELPSTGLAARDPTHLLRLNPSSPALFPVKATWRWRRNLGLDV